MYSILIVDDERSMREFLSILLRRHGHDVEVAESGEEAIALLDTREFDLVITDLKMPGASGLDVLRRVKETSPATEVILMTAHATTETAVEAMKQGARDYVMKPFKVDELLVQVEKALEVRRLQRENLYLRKELAHRQSHENIVGRSAELRRVFDMVARVAPTRTTVLITGESGTGKELVARAIHQASERANGPFIPVNCGAIPESLIESELFGHVRGAFTGANTDRKGLFAAASGGTIFLDEIGELPLQMQVRLLRVLQEKKIKRVGSSTEDDVDCRIIAATNRDLAAMVQGGTFREDLFYRLNVIQIGLPPLRDRREDIPLLIQHFLRRYADDMGKPMRGVESTAMDMLLAYRYPGNVRELENIVERAVTLANGEMVTADVLPPALQTGERITRWVGDLDVPETGLDLEEIVGSLEKNLLMKALQRSNGVRKEAARLLGITFRSMRYRLDKYGIEGGEGDLDES